MTQLIPYELNSDTSHGLTPRKMRFCVEVAEQIARTGGYNATDAAKAACWGGRYLAQQAAAALKDPIVRSTIESLVNNQRELGRVNVENIVREVANIAFHNVKDLYHEDGTVKPIHELTRAQAACITSIETITDPSSGAIVAHRYKLADKGKFFDMLGKYLAMWEGEGKQGSRRYTIQELAEMTRNPPDARG